MDDTGDRTDAETVIYTDGACKGNPGPGGWAWAIPGGRWSSGYDPETTNQRMEVTAAYTAVRDNPGRLRIVSDSTYVVNCFRDEWWKGWRARGWKNARKEPVANRDLWEPFVDLVERRDVTFEWVKGHSGDPMNDLVDRLAVAAVERRRGASGDTAPGPHDLGSDDPYSSGRAGPQFDGDADRAAPGAGASFDESSGERSRSPEPAVRDRRIPAGTPWSVVGIRSERLVGTPAGIRLRERLAQIISAQAELYQDLVVLSGGRAGAEQIGALAAADAGVPYVVVLPYPDPVPAGATSELERLDSLCRGARKTVTLESKRPGDAAARLAALARRDGWLRSVSVGALVVTADVDRVGSLLAADGHGARRAADAAEDQLRRFSKALGDEVWEIPVEDVA